MKRDLILELKRISKQLKQRQNKNINERSYTKIKSVPKRTYTCIHVVYEDSLKK